MTRRQTVPKQWLILDRTPDPVLWSKLRQLPPRTGVLLIYMLNSCDARRLRHLARLRRLTIVREGRRRAARVHNIYELRRALIGRAPIILISPIYPTSSHPEWCPLPRMRAATFARLAGRDAIGLGGMSQPRYAKIAPLGFIGWAGISAFRT